MLERRLQPGRDWMPYKMAGSAGGYVTRASARAEAQKIGLPGVMGAYIYRAAAYVRRGK